jgi:LuxR family maltose regulon positive regulatory protein
VALLDRLRTAAEGTGRDGSVAEILMLRALARHAGGDADEAMVPLAQALEAAVPAG